MLCAYVDTRLSRPIQQLSNLSTIYASLASSRTFLNNEQDLSI